MSYYYLHYVDNTELATLSKKIFNSTSANNTFKEHREFSIIYDNTRFNISSVLSKIIQELNYTNLTTETLETSIDVYNTKNNTKIVLQDFLNKSWIRIINKQVVLPPIIRRDISELINAEQNNGTSKIPEDCMDLFQCLKEFYIRFIKGNKLTITKIALEKIIALNPAININYFTEKEILKTVDNEQYEWVERGNYTRYLINEITTHLWLDIVESNHSIENYRKFIKAVSKLLYHPGCLKKYLSQSSIGALIRLSEEFLLSEDDIINSSLEIQKIYLDPVRYTDTTLNSPLPYFQFSASDTFELIEETEHLEWYHREILDTQASRTIYNLALCFLLENNIDEKKPYNSVLKLFKDTDRPFLVYTLYDDIQKHFPHIIPFMIEDYALAPTAFKLMDEITISPEICVEKFDWDKQHREKQEIINDLWVDGFKIYFSKLSKSYHNYEDYSKSLGQIMMWVTNKIFSFNSNNYQQSLISHQIYRKRYDLVLKLISDCKDTTDNSDVLSLKHRLFPILVPSIFHPLKNIKHLPPPNEFLKVETGLMDLSIELLRISNTPLKKKEVSEDVENYLNTTKTEIIKFIFEELGKYFTTDAMQIYAYTLSLEQRKVRRGVGDFGIEIIDWGYLFLNLNKYNLIDKLDETFNKSLIFDTTTKEEKYADQNKEQEAKIRFYLKTILLAHIMISQHKESSYSILFDKEGTLKKLEKLILHYSSIYSTDNISDSKIDVFNHKIYWFNSDIYYQPLTKLLYQAMNNFSSIDLVTYVNNLFETSTDIGRMLSLMNKIESNDVKKEIITKIESANLDEYVNSASTITELEDSLIEAVNSDRHFNFAEPLLKRIEAHLAKYDPGNESSLDFIYRVKLLLAYKKNDLEMLLNISPPGNIHSGRKIKASDERKKEYYIALLKLNHASDYDKAIESFQRLLSQEPKNIDYAFHLYKAKTLRAIQE